MPEMKEPRLRWPILRQFSKVGLYLQLGDQDPVFESEYPRYVGTRKLNEYGSYTSLSFSCGSRIAIIGSSTAPVWSIQVKNLTTGTNHVMTGTMFTSDTLYLNQQSGNWRLDVLKGNGDNCISTVRIHSN